MSEGNPATRPADPADLQRRFERMREASREYGPGGLEVLETAYHVLAAGREILRWPGVGLEDLWAHAIKEGRGLFPRPPHERWGRTGAAETKDMIGQTTIGPWQMTVTNVKGEYGRPFGLDVLHKDADVFAFCRDRPAVQAGMICDYVQHSYSTLGRRSPYAVQRYFWLKAYAKKEIGQGEWDKSVLPEPPDGDWRKLTAAMKRDTGFYAKQIVCGTATNPHGLLWWLHATADESGTLGVLRAWKRQRLGVWDEDRQSLVLADAPGGFGLVAEDFKHVPDASVRRHLAELLASVE